MSGVDKKVTLFRVIVLYAPGHVLLYFGGTSFRTVSRQFPRFICLEKEVRGPRELIGTTKER